MPEYFDPEAWLATGYVLLLLVIAAGLDGWDAIPSGVLANITPAAFDFISKPITGNVPTARASKGPKSTTNCA